MSKNKYILLSHGSGGRQSYELIESIFKKNFQNNILKQGDDSAKITLGNIIPDNENKDTPINRHSIAFTTDTFTVTPIFFPGGNIGDLAINGTINDLCASGATPLYLSVGFVLEEGLLISDLEKIVVTMAECANKAGIKIATGDTKVVNRGQCDKIFINTSGIGYIPPNVNISGNKAEISDAVIISGTIGDHGVAVMAEREGLEFQSTIKSDSYPMNRLVKAVLSEYPENINVMRDPTRGGLATTLNEIAIQSNLGIKLYEDNIPITDEVKAICEILGLDPMYIANEGKMLFICPNRIANDLVSILKGFPEGENSSIIGEITDKFQGKVVLETSYGGERFIDMLYGEALPRIC